MNRCLRAWSTCVIDPYDRSVSAWHAEIMRTSREIWRPQRESNPCLHRESTTRACRPSMSRTPSGAALPTLGIIGRPRSLRYVQPEHKIAPSQNHGIAYYHFDRWQTPFPGSTDDAGRGATAHSATSRRFGERGVHGPCKDTNAPAPRYSAGGSGGLAQSRDNRGSGA